MARPTIAPLSQERLVIELKRLVDEARFAPSGSKTEVDAINELVDLLRENVASALAAHVLHNIGCRRRRWLRELSAMMPREELSDVMWRMGCR